MAELNEEKTKELELLHKAIFIENSIVLPELITRLKSFNSLKSVDLLIEKLDIDKDLDSDTTQAILAFIREQNSPEHLQNILVNIAKHLGTELSNKLLMLCWEGQFNCSPHLSVFAGFAAIGNYHDAIEVLCIVDNLEEVPKDNEIIKAKIELSNAIKLNQLSDKSKLLELIIESIDLL
ncbi:MAG: hypothetical protein WCO37_04065 [Bacteroidota bacterium]|jgi:hypothetical protein